MARNVTIYTAAPPPTVEHIQGLPGVAQVKVEKKLFRPPSGFRFIIDGRHGTMDIVPAAEVEAQVNHFVDYLHRADRQTHAGPAASIVDDMAHNRTVEDIIHLLAATKTVLSCTVEEDFAEEQQGLPPALLALNRQLKGLAFSRKCLFNAEGKVIFGQPL
jgi:hypothetical protein